MRFIRETNIHFGRSMKHILRSPDTIITGTIMPIAILLLFVYVLGGAIQTGAENYLDYLLPGVLLVAIANGMGYTGARLFTDIQEGIFERFHSMPLNRSSILWGHVLTSLIANAVSLVIIIIVAVLMGFRPDAGPAEGIAIAGILMLFTLAYTWIAIIPSLTAKTMDGAIAVAYPLHLLPFVSSAFVPTETMPAAVRAFAENQPVTSIVNAVRLLLNSEPVGVEIWVALAWCAGISIAAYCFAMRAYKRRTA